MINHDILWLYHHTILSPGETQVNSKINTICFTLIIHSLWFGMVRLASSIILCRCSMKKMLVANSITWLRKGVLYYTWYERWKKNVFIGTCNRINLLWTQINHAHLLVSTQTVYSRGDAWTTAMHLMGDELWKPISISLEYMNRPIYTKSRAQSNHVTSCKRADTLIL